MTCATKLALGCLLLATACGGVDNNGELLAGRRAGQPGSSGATETSAEPTESGDGGGGTTPGSTPADGGSATGDGGTTPPPPPPAGTNAFTGAGAFVAQNGPNTIKGDHGADGNPAKRDCLGAGCHSAGGEGPRFIAGGTIYKDKAGTMPAAQIEVRLRDNNGGSLIAHTDANGNFFFRGAGVTLPALTGVRDNATTTLMAGAISNGACNSAACHGGAQGWIHIP